MTEWQKFRWERKQFPFSLDILHPTSKAHCIGIMMWFIHKDPTYHGYGNIKDGEARPRRPLQYLFQHGKIPEPVVLAPSAKGFLIADGHHRMAALHAVAAHRENGTERLWVDAWVAG